MVRAESVTATLVYTYNAAGLRVAQSVQSAPESVATFAWDWASGLPEMLATGNTLYLVGHETLGQYVGSAWTYYLPDALGSVRQATDGAGAVVSAREWSPYGEELGGTQAGLGYTGECFDGDVGMVYLRARWYEPGVGRFTRRDPWEGKQDEPQTLHAYIYTHDDPVNFTDPTGRWKWNGSDQEWKVPEIQEMAVINLNQPWRSGANKPLCCQEYSIGCTEFSVPLPLILKNCGNSLREQIRISNNDSNLSVISSADDYIKFWLAWEKLNPCKYRKHANCLGAALELSSLYTGSGVDADVGENGYADPRFVWPKLLDEGEFVIITPSYRNVRPDAGIIYRTAVKPFAQDIDAHFAISTGSSKLWFHKRGVGGSYELLPLSEVGVGGPYQRFYMP